MAVRSAELAHLAWTTTGVKTLATVPAGDTWLVKDVRYTNGLATTATFYLYVVRSGVSYGIAQLTVPSAGVGGLSLWVAAEAGDSLTTFTFGTPTAGVQVWISGAKLQGLAP